MKNNELKHHGILGMKWGVRRYQNPDGSLTAAGKIRYLKAYNHMSRDRINGSNYKESKYYKKGLMYKNKSVTEKNNNPKIADVDKNAVFKPSEDAEVKKKMNNISSYNREYVNSLCQYYAENKQRLLDELKYNDKLDTTFGELLMNYDNGSLSLNKYKDSMLMPAYKEYLTHPDKYVLFPKKLPYLNALNDADLSAAQEKELEADILDKAKHYAIKHSDDELVHWGILGMKWGVRRYQNADGSLTAAGRKRYGVNDKNVSVNKNHGTKGGELSSNNNQGAKSGESSSEPDINKSIKTMSDDELQKTINRLTRENALKRLMAESDDQALRNYVNHMELTKKYNELRPATFGEKAKKWISEVLSNAGKQVATDFVKENMKGLLEKVPIKEKDKKDKKSNSKKEEKSNKSNNNSENNKGNKPKGEPEYSNGSGI